jgi:F-type H+-transporting ATPase subunit gamma
MQIRPYSDRIRDFLEELAGQVAQLEHPLFVPRKSIRKIAAVVIAADKGLCGSYNANLLRHAERFLTDQAVPARIVAIGRKSVEHFKKAGADVRDTYTQIPTTVTFAEVKRMAKPLVDWYVSGEVDAVHLIFTRYVNAITFRPGHAQFLPIAPEKRAEKRAVLDFEFEPSPKEVLDALVPRYVEVTFHRLLLESMSSEHAARMNAMQNATDNASDLITSLTLLYNKSRQAGITKELLDIVGGAEALKG